MYSRRNFVKNAIQASAIFAFFPFRHILSSPKHQHELPSWVNLVELARWCPSIHNLQPHKLKIISETEADLYYDPARLLPVGDPNAVFVTVALAIFVEHLSIAAGASGAKVEISELFQEVSTSAQGLTLFARLKLSPANVKEPIDKSLIAKRRTSRLHYNGRALAPETVLKVRNEAAAFKHDFYESSERELIDFVIELNQQTLFDDLYSDPGREELHRLFRYTKEEAELKKDGLWAKCMDFPGKLMKSIFTHHERWETKARQNVLGNYYKSSFKGTASICWINGEFENTQDWLNAGRMMARTWLLFTEDMAYIHPFGNIITNPKAYRKFNEKIKGGEENKKLWMVFRAGYSKEPARSYRLSTNEIIIS